MDYNGQIFFEILDMLLWGYDKITEELMSLCGGYASPNQQLSQGIELKTMTRSQNKKLVKAMSNIRKSKKINLHEKIKILVDKMEKIEET